jgi:TusA-related sulfurtransferase
MQVANIDKGVTITLTGENAEAVKSVQDHAAKCAKHECCVSKEGKAGCCDKATCPMKDAKVQVTNNDKGAVITITSDKPEAVAAIQKCVADCHGAKGEAHAHKTEAKADACGKCPMKSDCTKQAAPEKEIK